jgi:hypothetical protein
LITLTHKTHRDPKGAIDLASYQTMAHALNRICAVWNGGSWLDLPKRGRKFRAVRVPTVFGVKIIAILLFLRGQLFSRQKIVEWCKYPNTQNKI